MADILNPKEDVIKAEITKYGRKRLSTGHFFPQYFSFIDDSIIYDSSCGGQSLENSNEIENRILNESLTFSKFNLNSEEDIEILGTSDNFSDFMPAWSLKMLNGGITYRDQESTYYKKIFNFDDIIYNLSFPKNIISEENVKLESDYILIDLQELNLEEDLKNFEIELIQYNELFGGISGGVEKKLLFPVLKSNIIDDYIYDEKEMPNQYADIVISENYASYYYDILVDEEIDTEYIISLEKFMPEKIAGVTIAPYEGSVCKVCCR